MRFKPREPRRRSVALEAGCDPTTGGTLLIFLYAHVAVLLGTPGILALGDTPCALLTEQPGAFIADQDPQSIWVPSAVGT